MYEKLRSKTGKRYVPTFEFGGKPTRIGTTGETTVAPDGTTYICLGGNNWVQDFSQSPLSLNTPTQPTSLTGTSAIPAQQTDLFSFGNPGGAFGQTTVSMTGANITANNNITGTTNLGTATTPAPLPQVPEISDEERIAQEREAWTTANDDLISAKAYRKGLARKDFTDADGVFQRDEYVAARQFARRQVQEARQARRTAAETEGGAAAQSEYNKEKFMDGFGESPSANGTMGSAVSNFVNGNWKSGLIDTAIAGVQAVDKLAMGDKNFGAQSEAIDGAVHAASSALLKSGNPYAMAAGAALEGANFLTKAGGQTVQGFDVDINSSGYGDLGHMESSSSRDFGAMIGLGGLFGQDKLKKKLAKRNAQAQMAMRAAQIADDQAFEQEARANSIQNTILNNTMALAGGLDTSLLGG